MGKKDIAVKRLLSRKDRFADLYNAKVFHGRQIVRAEDLEMLNGETGIILTDKEGKKVGLQRYRDIIMCWKGDVHLVLLACENQEKVHYAMPVRNMVYDSLTYVDQINRLWAEHKKKGERMTGGEYLSHFKKSDVLIPVITLVFYYGQEPWDGCMDLHGMMEKGENAEAFSVWKEYIPNYHINLIDVGQVEDITQFQTDLQVIMGMLQCRGKKERLLEYTNEHREYFGSMDLDTYNGVEAFLDDEGILKEIGSEGKEDGNMCKALEELYADGVAKGKTEGIAEGKEIGIRVNYTL